MARLFFALWPDEEAAAQLASLSASLADIAQGKPVPREKIHVTLAFLGEVDARACDEALAAAAGARSQAFTLKLDGVGSFKAARVGWAGCARVPAALSGLQSGLASRLRDRGFALEDRPFVPHVTLSRHARRRIPEARIAPIAWEAREFTLVRSETGSGRYVVMERWALLPR